jgi:hypothetical protein
MVTMETPIAADDTLEAVEVILSGIERTGVIL